MKLPFIAASLFFAPTLIYSVSAASFGDDTAFLKQHTPLIVLSDSAGLAEVAVAPAYQGRVMTSTASGEAGSSFGWINHSLIEAGKVLPHINAFGGEDRFWLGPEGGQFSLFFKKGDKFDLEHWQTPAALDTMAFPVISQSADRVKFGADFALTNFSGTHFELNVEREVRLLPPASAWKILGVPPQADVKMVAYESENKITNKGPDAWKQDTGTVSIWILGMFNPSPKTTIVVPIKAGPEADLGAKITSDYFGSVPTERLKVKDAVIYFSGDGKFRSKIGINPKRSKGVLGSYDAENKVLSIVQFDQPEGVADYVNSLWQIQEHPYSGDAENSYNDGAPSPGVKPLRPFYEMESSSPAAMLASGQSLVHVHRTLHLSGSESVLDTVAQAVLGVSLVDITSGLK